MKTTLISIILLTVVLSRSFADPYRDAMLKNIAAFKSVQNVSDYQEISNQFERIAKAEKTKWLPYYYAAFSTVSFAAASENSTKDQHLDKAQLLLDEAIKVEPKNSEIMALQAFIHIIRITVDPVSRGQANTIKASALLEESAQIDPKNGRTWLLMSQLAYGTAQFFNMDTSKACEIAMKAQISFEEEKNTSNKDEISPAWGAKQAEKMVAKCNEKK